MNEDLKLNDNPQELHDAMQDLVCFGLPFAITTCRSGLAVDMFFGDSLYTEKSERVAYTINNDGSLAKTIRETLEKVREKAKK